MAMYYLYLHTQDADPADPHAPWRRFRILYARTSRGPTRAVAQGTIGEGVYTVEEM